MVLKNSDICTLYLRGLGARQIAKALGVKHPATVYKRLRKLGLIRKKDSHLKRATKTHWRFNLNPVKFHEAAELFAQYWFVAHGFEIFVPSSSAPYDLLVSMDGHFRKIQVKSSIAQHRSGNYIFTLVRSRHNAQTTKKVPYKKEDTDFFFLLDLAGNAWLIPIEEIKQKTITPSLILPSLKVWPHGGMADAEDLINESRQRKR